MVTLLHLEFTKNLLFKNVGHFVTEYTYSEVILPAWSAMINTLIKYGTLNKFLKPNDSFKVT